METLQSAPYSSLAVIFVGKISIKDSFLGEIFLKHRCRCPMQKEGGALEKRKY